MHGFTNVKSVTVFWLKFWLKLNKILKLFCITLLYFFTILIRSKIEKCLGKNQENGGKANYVCFLLGNSPASEFYMPTFRNTLFHLHRHVGVPAYKDGNRQSVPKRRHIKFRRRGITQKKEHNIQNTAKVRNQEGKFCLPVAADRTPGGHVG